jgi:hypothetical protein
MKSVSIRFRSLHFARALFLVAGLLSTAISTNAQAGAKLPDWLTPEEKRIIEKENGEKDRVEALLKISSIKLNSARIKLNEQQYEQTSTEVKNYGSLIVYMSAFIEGLQKKEKDKKKLYKIVELSLRRDLGTLEGMRFELPQKYADEVGDVYDRVRKVREVALGAVFGKDFFPATEPLDEKNSSENPSKDN